MQRLINEIVERAKANRQRIVLPEGTEERTLKAANQILTDGVADLIILGKPAEIEACAKEWGLGNINKATIIDPEDHPKKEEYAQLLCELRKKKGMTIEEARKLVVDPLYLGCLIIKNGDADGQLAGARNTTGNVLRPALQAPLARAVAYLAVVSAMPSSISGSELSTAHWVVSSSCTSLEDPNTFWAMLLQPLRTTTASTAASAKARIRFVLLMFFYPQKQQVKNAISFTCSSLFNIA